MNTMDILMIVIVAWIVVYSIISKICKSKENCCICKLYLQYCATMRYNVTPEMLREVKNHVNKTDRQVNNQTNERNIS